MKRLFLIIAFWAAGVAGASAQMRLTLPQALDLALSENPTVKVAEMEVQRYDYVKRQTWGNLLPQISASELHPFDREVRDARRHFVRSR